MIVAKIADHKILVIISGTSTPGLTAPGPSAPFCYSPGPSAPGSSESSPFSSGLSKFGSYIQYSLI